MALGSSIPASLYTLPRLWDQLKADVHYDKRRREVDAFNKSSRWLKRGISITPARSATPQAKQHQTDWVPENSCTSMTRGAVTPAAAEPVGGSLASYVLCLYNHHVTKCVLLHCGEINASAP